jgi:carbonic anhydrase/acetyltransferase-like protein (isoleucine patch superfamily)
VISEKCILSTNYYSLTTGLILLGKTQQTDIAFVKEIKIWNNVFIGIGTILIPRNFIRDNVLIVTGCIVRGINDFDSIEIGNFGLLIRKLTDNALKMACNN